ncbi:uncharacterized protein EMH_0051090 [Eimeria mitis]|uniref:Reverse transcriptase domain-containing protein n=1 Tax=Eimeria mitis TaxID=44415 RepID=U6KDA5_9EIME|nr:uncharacterized protein EMH_0051090 [Eimeria mitis]CDJ35995.1 hypothetical protein EMH_0051090 [Eimeria mitis]
MQIRVCTYSLQQRSSSPVTRSRWLRSDTEEVSQQSQALSSSQTETREGQEARDNEINRITDPHTGGTTAQQSALRVIAGSVGHTTSNVKKALLALREEEKAQQGRNTAPESLYGKLKKRALERNLHTARRRLISVLQGASAQQLQTLYQTDRRKCVEKILADKYHPRSQDCPIPLTELETYFMHQHSEQSIDTHCQVANEFLDPLAAAPGGAKRIDLSFTEEAMTAIYNACSQHRKVPVKWKQGVTVLIPKGGDRTRVKNWRPINLQDCTYKLYAAMCKASLYMTYCDLKNAFAPIPNKLIHTALQAQRLPKHLQEIVSDLYEGASFSILTKEGSSGIIENRRGVKQGCPLSPILFSLAIDPLLRRLAACNAGPELHELKTVANSCEGISSLHQVVTAFFQWTGLEANPSECATMGWKVVQTKQQPDPVQLRLHNEVLPVVKLGEAYKYLGLKDALETTVHQGQILRVMSKVKKDFAKILRSALLPWQKLDAVRTFVMSRLDYHLRHCYPYKQQMVLFDRHIRAILKATFKLSKSTATEVFHQPSSQGRLGCTSLQTIATATQIGHAVQMLNSKDSMIQAVAEGQVLEVIKRAYVYTPDSDESDRVAILAYLNGRDIGCLKKRSKKVDIRSLWSELPGNISASKTRIETGSDGSYLVKTADGSTLDQEHIIRSIKHPDRETLAHVLNHCPHSLDSKIKERHNKALERITTAIKRSGVNRGKTIQIDSCPTDIETLLRPEIILRDGQYKQMAIAYVAIVFEGYEQNSF